MYFIFGNIHHDAEVFVDGAGKKTGDFRTSHIRLVGFKYTAYLPKDFF